MRDESFLALQFRQGRNFQAIARSRLATLALRMQSLAAAALTSRKFVFNPPAT